jgi:DNA-binding NtrC family response regulator
MSRSGTACSHVLVVDDDASVRSMYSKFLSRKGYDVQSGSSLGELRERLAGRRFDALLLDVFLPDGNSLDIVADLRRDNPDMAIVLMTAEGSVDIAVEAMRRGVDNFLCKPVNLPDLEVFLSKGLELSSLRRSRITHLRQAKRDPVFIGEGPAWKKLMNMARVAAEGENTVMITGETGTGKGVLARWIQENGPRQSEPFIEINCSSLHGDLLASELFGHVKGAFTSAVQDKQGLVEVANGGSLFLDEIGDMDIAVQAQFLKVIEEKQFRRVGEVRMRTSEFRLICATNHDLEQLCAEGRFRSDLFFRINVFPIHMPPLRDAKEDLPALARHLARTIAGKDVEFSDEIMGLLQAYSWPGNVRELRNVIERALLLARGERFTVDHFPGLDVTGAIAAPASAASLNLEDVEKAKIRTALDRFGGDTRKAAEALGISRATLYRRMKESGGKRKPGR